MARPDLFGADIAGAIFDALGNDVLDATLTRRNTALTGARDPAELTAGRTTFDVSEAETTAWSCKGFVDHYRDGQIDGTLIQRGDRKIVLLGKSLPDDIDPEPGMLITIEGAQWRIIEGGVMRDPAGATFTCQVRK